MSNPWATRDERQRSKGAWELLLKSIDRLLLSCCLLEAGLIGGLPLYIVPRSACFASLPLGLSG